MIVNGVFPSADVRDRRDGSAYLVGVLLTSPETVTILGLCQELDVGSTTLESFLQFDLILDNKGFSSGIDWLGEES